MDQAMFTRVTQALLSDQVVCHETRPSEYAFLQDEANRREVGDYLIRIDRAVRSTSDGKGFYGAYTDPNEPGAKTAIRRAFRLSSSELEPLVVWMRLAKDCHPAGRPIEAGMVINESEMLAVIERSPELNYSLLDLTKHALFKSTARDGRGRIRHILNKLEEKGYLVKLDTSGARYRATGEWSYLYDVLEFIRAHERIEIEEPDQQVQGGLI